MAVGHSTERGGRRWTQVNILMVLIILLAVVPDSWGATRKVLHNAATANADGANVSTDDRGSVGLKVTIAGTATVTFQGSADGGVTWGSLYCTALASTSNVSTTTATGQYQCNVAGLSHFRAPISGCSGCTVTVEATASLATRGGGSSGGLASTDIDTCAEMAALWTDETGTCGGPVLSQGPTIDSLVITTKMNRPSATAFPGSPSVGDVVIITDDSVTNACDSAAGTAVSECRWNGTSWVAIGNGTGPTILTMIETAAPGAPSTATHYRFYYDSTLNSLATHEQGGSAKNYVQTAASMTAGRCVQVASGGGTAVEAASAACGAGGTAGSPLFVQTATATAVTAAAETTILSTGVGSLTIPAGWFTAAGTVMDVRFSGKYSTGAVPGTLQLKLKFGATVVAQTVAFTPLTSVTDGLYSGFIRLIARTVGATGTIFVADGVLTTGSTLTPGEIILSNPTLGTAVTVDTTATNVVDLTATWGTGATNSITGYTFELVGPGSAVASVFGRTGAVVAAANDYTWAQLAAGTGTNLTFDTEGTGNSFTYKRYKWFPAGGCNNATSGPAWHLPTSNPAVSACRTGTNTTKGVLEFADGANALTAQLTDYLNEDWSGAIDATVIYEADSTSTNNTVWQLAIACAGDGESDDPAFTDDEFTADAGKATAHLLNATAANTITTTGTCAAGKIMNIRLKRDPAHASDTLAATAKFVGLSLKMRETQ